MSKTTSIIVQGNPICLFSDGNDDYISLTDMAKGFEEVGKSIDIWLRNKNTIEFLGVWERLNSPDFNFLEFEEIKIRAGLNSFSLSVKVWTQRTNAIGLIAKAGRYGGTFAHKDIAFEFGTWLSPEFKLYLIKEFQRLKEQEANDYPWHVRRELAKSNYQIQTDAIKTHLIASDINKTKQAVIYASEANLLNTALFGLTAKEWRLQNPDKPGNIRDYATFEQLAMLIILENQNALLIGQGYEQGYRLTVLAELARSQMKVVMGAKSFQRLKLAYQTK